MGAGWNLSEIPRNIEHHSEDELWSIINSIFSNKTRKTTTYKFCFLKSMIDNIFNIDENLQLSFEIVFERFTEIYWNLIVKHKLSQIRGSSQREKSEAEIVIEECLRRYQVSDETSFEALRSDIKRDLCRMLGQKSSKYVVGAFCVDTQGILYGFSKKSKMIMFNLSAYEFLVKYKYVIEKLNYFEWIKFLEKVNQKEAAFAIAEKLDVSSKRENLSFYRDFLLKEMKTDCCFYCEKKLADSKIEVDHFIPWSFVKDDKAWNFVLACRACNNKKRDKLADKQFLRPILSRNKNIIENPVLLDMVKDDLCGYHDEKIISMYNSAEFNGFDSGWMPLS